MKIFDLNKLVNMVRLNKDIMHKIQEYVKFDYCTSITYYPNGKTEAEINDIREKNAAKERVAFEIYQDIIYMLDGDMTHINCYTSDINMITSISVDLLDLLLKPKYPKRSWSRKYKNFQIVWTGSKYMILNLSNHTGVTVDSLLDYPVQYLLYPAHDILGIEAAVQNAQELIYNKHISIYRAIQLYNALEDMLCGPIYRFYSVDMLIEFIAYDDGEKEQ